MTTPLDDNLRQTKVLSFGGRSIVVKQLTELQMMHLGRYSSILSSDEVETKEKLDCMKRMLNILHSCVAEQSDLDFLIQLEETGEVSLTDMLGFAQREAPAEPVRVQRGRVRRAAK